MPCRRSVRIVGPWSGSLRILVSRFRIPSQDRPDVVQDVLTDATRQLRQGHFREAAALATWVHRIALGKVADYWRKLGRARLIRLDDVADSHEVLVATGNPDAVVAVNQALSCLSTEDQLLLVLQEQQGYTLQEISPIIGLRKSAVAARLARAREQFRLAILGGGRNLMSKRLKD
jgi:RNA polymerase sigma factor (sigma-70 family)